MKKDNKFAQVLGLISFFVLAFMISQSVIGFALAIFVYWFVLPQCEPWTDVLKDIFMIVGVFLYVGACYYTSNVNSALYDVHMQYFGSKAFLTSYGVSAFDFIVKHRIVGFVVYFLAPVFVYTISAMGFFRVFGRLMGVRAEKMLKNVKGEKKPRLDKMEIVKDAVALGASYISGKPVYVPHRLLKQHVCLVGTTGAGKTVTLYNFVVDAILNEKAIVFIDGKGDIGNIEKFKHYTDAAGKIATVITMDGTNGYNAFGSGSPSELTDKIISMFDWSEEHYKLQASRYLQLLVSLMQLRGVPVNLASIITYCDRDRINELGRPKGQSVQAVTALPDDDEDALPSFNRPLQKAVSGYSPPQMTAMSMIPQHHPSTTMTTTQ